MKTNKRRYRDGCTTVSAKVLEIYPKASGRIALEVYEPVVGGSGLAINVAPATARKIAMHLMTLAGRRGS
jgi:hypothetical protein